MQKTEPKYFWEDFKLGEKVQIGSVVMDRDELIEFASRYDPQTFHIDEDAAKHSIYGGLIASGWHSCALVMRLICDSYMLDTASLGSPGVDEVRWPKPVRPGDRLTVFRTTTESRVSRSRPEAGIIKTMWEVENQDGEIVMTMTGINLLLRRHSGATT